MPTLPRVGDDRVDFVIVGTARSGTTLLQRLASELPGVCVPPETHVLSHLAPGLLGRRSLPLGRDELGRELGAYLALPCCRGLDLDVASVVDRLGGRCDSVLDLLAAVAAQLAGPCRLLGEKTPEHLLWWRPLTDAWPHLKVVAVVRDPRAVVASALEVPFGMDHVDVLTERWLADQATLAACRRHLTPDRMLVLRYEDVVVDPEAARRQVAELLGAELSGAELSGSELPGAELSGAELPGSGVAAGPARRGPGPAPRLYHDWETWKLRVNEPVTTARAARWEEVLTPRQAVWIAATCRPAMHELGYEVVPGPPPRGVGGPGGALRRRRYRRGRRRLEALAAGAGPRHGP